jgi:hypothetical protein
MITATDLMLPSQPDTVALGEAVEGRFLDLCGAYLRIKGEELTPPPDLDSAMLLWRTMRVRHKRGDYRNSRSELAAARTMAQWTLSENCRLRNQPDVVVQWRD